MSSPTCAYFNRTIPALVSDERKPEDVDTDGEDHAGDATRYWAMSRPMPGQTSEASRAARQPGTFGWWKSRMSERREGILGRRERPMR